MKMDLGDMFNPQGRWVGYIDFWNGNTEGSTRLLPFIHIFELAHY
jgi:hypothetical protein